MKKNFFLLGLLILMLLLTYYLVEILPGKENKNDQDWRNFIQTSKKIKLLNTQFAQSHSEWLDLEGMKVRTEFLVEFTKILASLSFLESIQAHDQASFFEHSADVSIEDVQISIGDLTPDREKFYFKKSQDPKIYLMPLDQVPSVVMGESVEKLNENKWLRLRDFIFATKEDWQEKSLYHYSQIGAFDQIKINDFLIKKNDKQGEFFDQFSQHLLDLQWSKKITAVGKIEKVKITFFLNEVVKDEWIFYSEEEIYITSSKYFFKINPATWKALIQPILAADFLIDEKLTKTHKVLWNPFQFCPLAKDKKMPKGKIILCPAGFEVTLE